MRNVTSQTSHTLIAATPVRLRQRTADAIAAMTQEAVDELDATVRRHPISDVMHQAPVPLEDGRLHRMLEGVIGNDADALDPGDRARITAWLIATATTIGATERQLQVLRLVLAGKPHRTIAAELGLDHRTVGRVLTGKAPCEGDPGRTGLLERIAREGDIMALKKVLEDARALEEPESPASIVSAWFADIKYPHQAAMFVPYTVLLCAFFLADKKGNVDIKTLRATVPLGAVDAALHSLQVMGFIIYDGLNFTIKRTPISKAAG